MPTPNRDAEYLANLRDYYAETRRIPTQQRIADLIGFSKAAARKSTGSASKPKGFIVRTPDDDAWIPAQRFSSARWWMPASRPARLSRPRQSPLNLSSSTTMSFGNPPKTVMIPIKGESMIDAGINDGDVAVVERGLAARAGDFVIAIVDNEFTLKELATERGQFILKPHNKAFPVIRPRGSLEIFGVLVGLIRRYRH